MEDIGLLDARGCILVLEQVHPVSRGSDAGSETVLIHSAYSRRFHTLPPPQIRDLLVSRNAAVASMVVTVDGKMRKVIVADVEVTGSKPVRCCLPYLEHDLPFCCPLPVSEFTGFPSPLVGGVENGR